MGFWAEKWVENAYNAETGQRLPTNIKDKALEKVVKAETESNAWIPFQCGTNNDSISYQYEKQPLWKTPDFAIQDISDPTNYYSFNKAIVSSIGYMIKKNGLDHSPEEVKARSDKLKSIGLTVKHNWWGTTENFTTLFIRFAQ